MWLALLLIFVLLSTLLVLQRLRLWQRRLPNGPFGLPILGYLPFIRPDAPYLTLSSLVDRYGKVYSLQLGQVTCVVVADADVLRRCFARAEFGGRAPLYLTHGIMGGMGLICAQGDLWRSQRRFVAEFMRTMSASGERSRVIGRCLLESLKSLRSRDNDLDKILSHTIGNMMNEIIFGMTYEEDHPMWIRLQKLRQQGIKEVDVLGPVNFLSWLRHFPPFEKTLLWIKEGQRESHQEYARVFSEERDGNNLTRAFLEARDETQGEERDNLFSDSQLHHLQADLFGAGTDTSMTTIKWCVLYLCVFKELQEEIYNEIVNYFEKDRKRKDDLIDVEDVPHLPQFESFLLEVQRLRPVVPLGVPHGTICEVQMEEKWTLPSECMVIPLHWRINRDPDLWTEPDEFRPFRFVDDESGRCKIPSQFMPFQVGRRRCVGEDFGRSLVFVFVANLVRSFKLSLSASCRNYDLDQIHDHGFTLSPKPFRVDAVRREGRGNDAI